MNELLDEALGAWSYTRRSVIDEIENLPADRFGFRPAEASRSVAELVMHIIRSGLMMAGELSRPDGDFARQSFDEHLAEHAGGLPDATKQTELAELLRSTHERGEQAIRAAGAGLMARKIRQFDGTRASRLTWMHHGISHEEYHRGQLALYARLLGVTPALTQRIQAEG
jgi:uncharacterized damage-inducible protein DinB